MTVVPTQQREPANYACTKIRLQWQNTSIGEIYQRHRMRRAATKETYRRHNVDALLLEPTDVAYAYYVAGNPEAGGRAGAGAVVRRTINDGCKFSDCNTDCPAT